MTVAELIAILGVEPPLSVSDDELAEWLDWWRESAKIARLISPDQVAHLKAGGWWPPVTTRQINEPAPLIVRKALRAGLGAGGETGN